MSKSYVIRWRSKVNGRVGKGSRFFEKGEAQSLAKELNMEYPEIEHEVVDASEEPSDASQFEGVGRKEHALSQ